jgi:hypothetical protein
LAIAAVERVLPPWDGHFPGDDWPRRMIDAARGYLAGSVSFEEAERAWVEGWSRGDSVNNESFDRGDEQGIDLALVCYAASRAVFAALYDERFDPGRAAGSGEEDGEIEPDEQDAAYIAAAAVAGGYLKDPRSDKAARREFWEWYLAEAVPAAWAAA